MSNQTIIIIKEKEDTTPAIPLNPGETVVDCTLHHFVILEGGMASGRTSVCFHTVDDLGKHILIETTGSIFEAMIGTYQGAQIRFKEKKAKKN